MSTALWEGEALMIVRGMPALVCQSCKERYFADATVMRLDLMRAGGFSGLTPAARLDVPVYDFPSSGGERS